MASRTGTGRPNRSWPGVPRPRRWERLALAVAGARAGRSAWAGKAARRAPWRSRRAFHAEMACSSPGGMADTAITRPPRRQRVAGGAGRPRSPRLAPGSPAGPAPGPMPRSNVPAGWGGPHRFQACRGGRPQGAKAKSPHRRRKPAAHRPGLRPASISRSAMWRGAL